MWNSAVCVGKNGGNIEKNGNKEIWRYTNELCLMCIYYHYLQPHTETVFFSLKSFILFFRHFRQIHF